ncbi:hypothetical protein PINS_up021071 [Pythium insidiosum]|nr:hypothetical protein PINS_up021071 [Pythium insidiosum]
MLSGGLERFYKKYNHLSRKINLQLPTPEVRFENLSFDVQVPAKTTEQSTVGAFLKTVLTPWDRPEMVTKTVLHPMSGVIKPGSMTLILANPGAGKSDVPEGDRRQAEELEQDQGRRRDHVLWSAWRRDRSDQARGSRGPA